MVGPQKSVMIKWHMKKGIGRGWLKGATVYSLGLGLSLLGLAAWAQGNLAPAAGPGAMMKSLDQIEPRQPLTAATIITQPGSYYLTGNLTISAGNAITIAANNVWLDLNGFTISSTATPAAGSGILFSVPVTNIWIGNGFIASPVTNNGTTGYGGSGFANGIYYAGTAIPVQTRVTGIMVSGCVSNGIYLTSNFGVYSGDTVAGCVVNNCGYYGIFAEQVTDCLANSGGGTGVGGAAAIYALNASRCRGTCYNGVGVQASRTADACTGISLATYAGLVAGNAVNCYGKAVSYGLNAGISADTCYGETSAASAGLNSSLSVNNCFGNNTRSGASAAGIIFGYSAIGSLGIATSPTSYGLLSGNAASVLDGCFGVGTTAISVGNKYDTP